MKYFRLWEHTDPTEHWRLNGLYDATGVRFDPRVFAYGQRVENSYSFCLPEFGSGEVTEVVEPMQFRLRRQGVPLGITMADGGAFVGSEYAADLLSAFCGDALQCITVEVESCKGWYSILNAASLVDCIDHDSSKIEYWNDSDNRPDKLGQPKAIYRLKIDPMLAKGRHFFRLMGWEVALIVSEQCKDVLEKHAITGASFVEV